MNIEATSVTRKEVLAMISENQLPFLDRVDLVFGQIIIHALQKKDSVYIAEPLFTQKEFIRLERIMYEKGFGTTTVGYTDLMIYILDDPNLIRAFKKSPIK